MINYLPARPEHPILSFLTTRPFPPILLLVLLYVTYGLFLTVASLDGFPATLHDGRFLPYLADKPVGEDGFYMLTVAWNIADGRGIVYNYGAPTTGIQPLSTAIFSILAYSTRLAGGTKWTFVRAVLGFGVLSHIVLAHIVGLITARLASRPFGALAPHAAYRLKPEYQLGLALTLFNFTLFRWCTYGLETGIYLSLFGATVLYTLTLGMARWTLPSTLLLGILAGLTAWARIDFGLIFAVFLVWIALRFGLSRAAIAGGAALVTIAPWLAYVALTTGTVLPSSGAAQARLATMAELQTRLWQMIKVILNSLVPWVYSSGTRMTDLMAAIFLVAFIVIVCRPSGMTSIRQLCLSAPSAGIWFLGVGLLLALYTTCFWATHFYSRYESPLLIIVSPMIAILLAGRIERKRPSMLPLILYTVATLFFAWCVVSLHTGRIGNQHVISAGYIKAHWPTERVGAFQSGVIGFFNNNVLNLDGKLDQDALKAIQDNAVSKYIDGQKVDVLIDWPESLRRLDGDYLKSRWQPCVERVQNESVCLQRRGQF